RHRTEAEQALETLSRRSQDSGIYHLKTVDQVIQRSKAMLKRAQGIVLCDLFPGPFALLADSLGETAARGVHVFCKVYNNGEIPGVKTLKLPGHDPALDKWPGQQITVVIDSEEHLLGLLARDMKQVHEAVWSNSTLLSCMHHNNMAAEILFTCLKAGHEDLLAAVEEEMGPVSLLTFRPSGLETLVQRCSSDTPSPKKEDAS
ncbi:MAG: hypothetical protein KJ645_05030, partial [Planctomycetes bacterium]|nr:hypothetical protein [Planctomycetota bacterium]